MKNWKTTVAGIGAVMGGVGNLIYGIMGGGEVDQAASLGMIAAGIGLITAGDAS